jgi:hypothetical protein
MNRQTLVEAGMAIVGLVVIIGIIVLVALPTILLWNWLMPELFGVAKINFFHVLGVIALTSIIYLVLSVARRSL